MILETTTITYGYARNHYSYSGAFKNTGMDKDTGIFTAPFDGTYQLLFQEPRVS